MFRQLLYFILISFTLNACFEEDERVQPYLGEVTVIPDSVQSYQSYFDFETGRIVKTFHVRGWQLGFECGAEGWHISTNSGAGWFIYNTGQSVIDAVVTMPTKVDHLFDMPSAFPDSTAIGNWVSHTEKANIYTHNVYLLGYYHEGNFNAIKQVVFTDVNDTAYRFFFKEQSSGLSDTAIMIKNDSVNYVYYDFSKHSQVSLEPDKAEWDIAFGPYYDLATLFGVTIPYPVAGSFLNAGLTVAVLDSTNTFDDINGEMIAGYQFRSQRDIPGYRWKGVTVDISAGSAAYAVKANYNYIFHTAQDHYFKLKFLSYTLEGRSGFPQFEYRFLQ